jgi:hypothetical protein
VGSSTARAKQTDEIKFGHEHFIPYKKETMAVAAVPATKNSIIFWATKYLPQQRVDFPQPPLQMVHTVPVHPQLLWAMRYRRYRLSHQTCAPDLQEI